MASKRQETWTALYNHLFEHAVPETAWRQILNDTSTFFRAAATLHRIAEESCNGTTPEREAWNDKKETGVVKRLRKMIAARYPGLGLHVSGDPRGYVLHITGLPGNTLGGNEVGYGVGY